MHIFKLPDASTEPAALWRQLLREPGAATTTQDAIRALNSHVNFDRALPAGTVLILPDATDLNANAGSAVGAGELADSIGNAEAAIKAIAERVAAGFRQHTADHAAIGAALKSAAARRLVDADPEVAKRLQAADAQFKADQPRATDTQAQLAAMQKQAPAEFERLRKMLAG